MKKESEILKRINGMCFEKNRYFKESAIIIGIFMREIKKIIEGDDYFCFFGLNPIISTLVDTDVLLHDAVKKEGIGKNQNKEDKFLQIKTNLLFITTEYFKKVNDVSMADRLKETLRPIRLSPYSKKEQKVLNYKLKYLL